MAYLSDDDEDVRNVKKMNTSTTDKEGEKNKSQ